MPFLVLVVFVGHVRSLQLAPHRSLVRRIQITYQSIQLVKVRRRGNLIPLSSLRRRTKKAYLIM